MTAEQEGRSLLVLGVLLLAGTLLRIRSRTAQKLFLPAPILAGAPALLAGPEALGAVASSIGGSDAALAGGAWPDEWLTVRSTLPGLLISVVSATLFLGGRIPRPRTVAHARTRSRTAPAAPEENLTEETSWSGTSSSCSSSAWSPGSSPGQSSPESRT